MPPPPRAPLRRRGVGVLLGVALIGTALLARAAEQPVPPSYLGAQACALCHRDLAARWSQSTHGKALSAPSLPPGSQGCEACHGPGSAHAGSTGKLKLPDPKELAPSQVEAMCGKCHLAGATAGTRALDAPAWRRSGHRAGQVTCTACHRAHGGAEGLAAPAEKLCLTCHSDLAKRQTHAPVKSGQCLLCHDPHGTSRPHSVRKDIGKVCEQCHQPKASAHQGYQVSGSDCTRCHDPHSTDTGRAYLRKVAHPPFQQGKCQVCHVDPPSTQLRKGSVGATCAACHNQDKLIADGTVPKDQVHVHAPVSAGLCTTCHDAHVSDTAAGLVAEPAEVCATCHRAVTTTAKAASHQHPPAAKGDCLSCHKPHASAQKGLLKQAQADLCASCHKDQAAHAHPVGPNVKDPNTGQPVLCTSCHAVHGSEFKSILPQEETAMCLTCHRMEH